jgi:hypothetical protein
MASYLEKHQGCPLDAIYYVRSDFIRKHGLSYIDYSQIFKDFELIEMNEEQKDNSLIDKCIIVATRTKEVLTLQERTPTDTEEAASPTSKMRQLDNYLIEYFLTRAEANSKESYDFNGFPFYLSD